jgi:hypothetical protein
MLLVIGAVFAGALAVFLVPSTSPQSGASSMHMLIAQSGLKDFHLVDLNPLHFIFDFEQKQINTPMTPDQLGFHGSPVVLKSYQWPSNSFGPAPALGLGGFDPQTQYELQQNAQRMQGIQNYMRDATGTPPPQ